MLEKKLGEARLRSTKLRKQLIIGFLVTIAVCGFILAYLSSSDYFVPEDSFAKIAKEKTVSEAEIEKTRDKFKKILQQYKSHLKPRLQASNIESWDRDTFFWLSRLEKKMMHDFSNSDYQNAMNSAQELETKALAILEKSDQIFKKNIDKAASFLADDRYDEAKLHIEKTLVVAPHSLEAQTLKQRIEKLRHILSILNEAKVARAEQDFLKEYKLLQKILQIDSERTEETGRLNRLEKIIKNKKFDTNISFGFDAIATNKLDVARDYYQKAKKIDAERKELKMLLEQIVTAERAHRIQQNIKQAKQAINDDDWHEASIRFAKVIKDMPENEIAIEGLKRTNKILELKSTLYQYIKNPYRLTDDSILSSANKSLTQAKNVSSHSPGLKRQIEQLQELIVMFNRLIPVKVTSDNKTYVLVRGIGKLGVIFQKTIQLKPGNYTFEGTRKGFKTKLLQILIPYDQNNYSIHIICDEPI